MENLAWDNLAITLIAFNSLEEDRINSADSINWGGTVDLASSILQTALMELEKRM